MHRPTQSLQACKEAGSKAGLAADPGSRALRYDGFLAAPASSTGMSHMPHRKPATSALLKAVVSAASASPGAGELSRPAMQLAWEAG